MSSTTGRGQDHGVSHGSPGVDSRTSVQSWPSAAAIAREISSSVGGPGSPAFKTRVPGCSAESQISSARFSVEPDGTGSDHGRRESRRTLVQDALDEVPLPHAPARAVDRAGTNQGRGRASCPSRTCSIARLLRRVVRVSGLDRRLPAFVDRDRKPRELLGRLRLLERSPVTIGIDGGGRDDNQRSRSAPFRASSCSACSARTRRSRPGHRCPCRAPARERPYRHGRPGRGRRRSESRSPRLPTTTSHPRRWSRGISARPVLAGAAEKKCAPRHRRDDSSLIF